MYHDKRSIVACSLQATISSYPVCIVNAVVFFLWQNILHWPVCKNSAYQSINQSISLFVQKCNTHWTQPPLTGAHKNNA